MTPVPGSVVSTRSRRAAASGCPVGHHHHAGVDRVAHTDAAAVVDRDPGGPGHGVEERVEDRPVGHGVGTVEHAFGLAVGRGHRARVEVVAADDDRGLHSAAAHEVVEDEPHLRALAVAEPADAGGKALRLHPLAGERDPPGQAAVPGEGREDGLVRGREVVGVAGEAGPAERALALAEERPDVGGHEPGEVEGVFDTGLHGLGPDVVAVVEDDRAQGLQVQHGLHVLAHAAAGLGHVPGGVRLPEGEGVRRSS